MKGIFKPNYEDLGPSMPPIKCPGCGFKTQVITRNYMGTCQCEGCGKILGIKISEDIVQEVFVVEYFATLPDAVPEDVKDDFKEAITCFNAQAYKATVVMCRRAIETLADLKGARGSNLYHKLHDLQGRGLLEFPTYNLATGIRQFGSYGAHPQQDLLKDVDRGLADLVLRIGERLIKELCQ